MEVCQCVTLAQTLPWSLKTCVLLSLMLKTNTICSVQKPSMGENQPVEDQEQYKHNNNYAIINASSSSSANKSYEEYIFFNVIPLANQGIIRGYYDQHRMDGGVKPPLGQERTPEGEMRAIMSGNSAEPQPIITVPIQSHVTVLTYRFNTPRDPHPSTIASLCV